MSKILKVNRPSDYASWVGHTDSHPLISAIDYSEVSPIRHSLNHYDVYGIFLRDDEQKIDLRYGCGEYDYKKGTLICVAPGQIGGKEDNDELVSIAGWALLFHPDLLHGTRLEKDIHKYTFFDYRINEALHMTEREKDIVLSIMRRLSDEINSGPADESHNTIITGLLALLLDYCQRFYNRQFHTREIVNSDILSRFESLLKDYFARGLQRTLGLPTVQYCSEQMCMSANYLGDVIKKVSGTTAGSHIRSVIVQEAKNRLASGLNISQTAFDLGFDYPQHFSRMFKRVTGMTPLAYLRRR